jgi:spermidine/putrescine transport system substrate-binding protein
VAVSVALALAGCGGASDSSSTSPTETTPAPAPVTSGSTGTTPVAAPVSGTLRTFTYDDTVDPKLMKPFEAQNPDLDVETATFDSDDEAAAKIRGGFSTDVIEVCLDEAKPLTDAGLLAPIDTSKITSWNDLDPTFRDAPGVSVDGNVIMVPLDAGPQGIIYDKASFPNGVDSYQTLFDPQYAGKVALDSSWLTAFAETALAMGITDPMHMSDDQVEQVKQKLLSSLSQFRSFARGDSDMANMFKSGEVILSDGGRGTAAQINTNGGDDDRVAPKEGALSWVCGLGISTDAENVDAAYAFINYYASPEAQGVVGDLGYVVINTKGVAHVSSKFRDTADPAVLAGAIAETQPDNGDLWRRGWQEVKAG